LNEEQDAQDRATATRSRFGAEKFKETLSGPRRDQYHEKKSTGKKKRNEHARERKRKELRDGSRQGAESARQDLSVAI